MDLITWLTSYESLSVLMLFIVLVLCGVGLPLPEDIPLVSLGYLWHSGDAAPLWIFLAGFGGVLMGDMSLYYIGRRFGPELFRHPILFRIFTPRRINRAKARIRKYGMWVVFFGRFLAGFRAMVFFTAGATRVPFRKFIFIDFMASLVSIPVWIGLGFYFGEEIDQLLRIIKSSKDIAFLVIVGVIVLYLLVKFLVSKLTSRNSKI